MALAILLSPVTSASAATVNKQFKETVGFVYVLTTNGKVKAYGTGFFVGVKNQEEKEKNVYSVYFITAKHVLKTPDRRLWHPVVLLRLNKKDGTSKFVKVPIVTKGKNKTVYVHDDESVDIAVIPALPDQKVYT